MIQRVVSIFFAALCVTIPAISGFAAESQQPSGRKSFTALQSEVHALKVEKVAWRQIQWKTCLLEGLKASREQKKPLMLWIFIDRPFDDERC